MKTQNSKRRESETTLLSPLRSALRTNAHCCSARRTRCEEVLVMLRLVQRMVRVRRKDRGRHQGVSVLQDGHPGGQAAAEGRGEHLPQRLGLVQNVVNEKRRGPLRGRRRRVVETHGWVILWPSHLQQQHLLSPRNGLQSLMRTLHKRHGAEHLTDISGRARRPQVFGSGAERIGPAPPPFSQLELSAERGSAPVGSRVPVPIGGRALEAGEWMRGNCGAPVRAEVTLGIGPNQV